MYFPSVLPHTQLPMISIFVIQLMKRKRPHSKTTFLYHQQPRVCLSLLLTISTYSSSRHSSSSPNRFTYKEYISTSLRFIESPAHLGQALSFVEYHEGTSIYSFSYRNSPIIPKIRSKPPFKQLHLIFVIL